MCSEQSAFHVEVRRRLSALETGTPQPLASVDCDQEVEDTLEEEGMERPEHGSAVEHGSYDLFIRFKLDQLEPMLRFLPELAVLDRYRKNPS